MMMTWVTAAFSVGIFAVILVGGLQIALKNELDSRGEQIVRMIEEDLSEDSAQNRRSDAVVRVMEVLRRNKSMLSYIQLHAKPMEGGAGEAFTFLVNEDGNKAGAITWQRHTPEEVKKSGGPKAPVSKEGKDLMPTFFPGQKFVRQYSQVFGDPSFGWASVSIGMRLDNISSALQTIYRSAWMTGGALTLLGALTAFLLASNLIRPLRALQSLAQKVAGGALNARASVKSGGEIGDLADSMNSMIESLEQSQSKLRDSMKSAASLREKEILLREIHHRVKNNMQILTSLLRLQTRQAESPELREVLMESEARIRSMGLLHEKLYKSESVSTIDMNGYLQTLTNELKRSNTPKDKKREIKLNVQGISMGLDTALPCGLMITELVTNSLKYAFPNQDEGSIYISLGTDASGDYKLVVWDNGVGISEDFDFRKATSLGMRLVKMLTDQLNGELAINGHQGTRVEITFKETLYKGRY